MALDFLNSIAVPSGAAMVEWLGSGLDLLDWLERAGAVEEDVIARFRAAARRDDCRVLDKVAVEARILREWLRSFIAGYAGAPLPAACLGELAPLNRMLAGDQAYRQIVVDPGAGAGVPGSGRALLAWRHRRRWTAPDRLLLPIAEAAGDLICGGDLTLVRKCESSACRLLFYDRTKSRARRWCSMAVCGNRAKAAAHRARQRAQSAPA